MKFYEVSVVTLLLAILALQIYRLVRTKEGLDDYCGADGSCLSAGGYESGVGEGVYSV